MASVDKEYLKDHKLFRIRNKKLIAIFPLVAVLVAVIVFWYLKLVGITVTTDALCGVEEHIHTDECYADGELVCAKPEHTHSAECFPDMSADIETSKDWKKTFEHVVLTNDVAENLVSIASTQVGYTESALNYEYDGNAVKHSYTRYGDWYGIPYGNWDTKFVSFCLNYSNINDSDSLISASAETMRLSWQNKNLYFSSAKYSGARGDVVFFDTNSDKKADRTGIVIYKGENVLIAIEGNVDGAVKQVVYKNTDKIMGYGKTSGLYAAEYIVNSDKEQSDGTSDKISEVSGRVNRYIPNTTEQPVMFRMTRNTAVTSVYASEPLVMMSADDHGITYTSHLEDEVVGVVFREQSGVELGNGDTVYIGEIYQISLEFSEINTGSEWIQFRHNEDGYLTYHLPENIHCEPFDDWHTISAKTENGTITDVGEYFMDETGLLRVKFYEDTDGINFVEKYSNVDFTIDFNATVASAQSGSSTDIKFNDKIDINLNVDGTAGMDVTKTHGEYDADNHTMEYTIRVEAIHGVVKDLVIDDQIWENHYALRNTIVVTDLEGNIISPQPTVSDHPLHSGGAQGGFSLSGFPDFPAGQGFLIKYKAQIYDELLSNDSVGMWNGIDATGKDSLGGNVYKWGEDWVEVELEKIQKDGKQVVVEDNNGNDVSVIEWQVEIRKDNHNLQGTVIIDTLGDGLAYFTDKDILVRHYDEWGNRLPDSYISWNNVTINGNSMSFPLPDGYAFNISYYTTYEEPDEGETINYTNSVRATINGREEQAGGTANVVGFVPHVEKSASGNDGEFVTFTIEADVPAVIKDMGNFLITDLAAFWGYPNDAGYLYIENSPQDMVITATTESGRTVTFTPYKAGGPVENTYILEAPAEGNQMHSFVIYFNTADTDAASSKWILDENAKLTVTYKIPFDAKTGTEWEGELTGRDTLEDVLLDEHKLSNEVYFNYTNITQDVASTTYEYSPRITKKSSVHEDGNIDYTVLFNNTIPGSGGNEGYINGSVQNLWFNDTFDERLHYVDGSLIVTTYSPWNKDLWICKYQYTGTVTGNTIRANAADFQLLDYNEEADAHGWNWILGATNFKDYYSWVGSGGRHEYTYKLKVEDEYLYTTDYAKLHFDNTAELTWDNDGSSGPVTETTEFYTGLLHKHVVQDDERLDFEVHINRMALDILEGAGTLTVYDKMTPNLSVYWESIKLKYEDGVGTDVWVDFDSPESRYTYTVTYDPTTNSLTFIVPDSLHIIIDYTTLITESGLVSVENSVLVDGKAEVADIVDALFNVQEHSGDASGSNQKITLLKQDGITDMPLANASFLLYGLKGDSAAVRPAGVSPTIITDDGKVLKFIGVYTTGADGTSVIESQYLTVGGPYALVEHVAPEGYELLEKPVYFYFYQDDPNGEMQTVTTLVAIENFNGSFLIPETGSTGTFFLATIGIALVAFPILYSLIRRKRERRLIG